MKRVIGAGFAAVALLATIRYNYRPPLRRGDLKGVLDYGPVVQLARTPHLQCGGQRFDPARVHQSF